MPENHEPYQQEEQTKLDQLIADVRKELEIGQQQPWVRRGKLRAREDQRTIDRWHQEDSQRRNLGKNEIYDYFCTLRNKELLKTAGLGIVSLVSTAFLFTSGDFVAPATNLLADGIRGVDLVSGFLMTFTVPNVLQYNHYARVISKL